MAISREAVVRDLTTRHLLLTADGRLLDPSEIDHGTLTDVQRRLLGLASLPRDGVGQAIDRLLGELRLGGPEPASDKGHFRYYPRGVLVRRLLRDWLERYVVAATGGLEVQTPRLFRWDRPLRDLAGSFQQLLYHVTDGINGRSQTIMRYGADPGFFALMRRATVPPDQFPFHVYELTDAFRRHKTGEVSSLLRARTLTFYDHHALCRDPDQAYTEFLRMLHEQRRFLDTTGRHYDLELVLVEDALPGLLPVLTEAAAGLGVPAYLTVLSAAKHYYRLVSNFCDPHGMHTLQIQVDHDNARRFGLAGCPRQHPDMSILHMSSGAIERWLVGFLRDGADRPHTATLPLWLSPTQVRVLPHTDSQDGYARQVRDALERAGVRADVDNRSRSLRHRLAAAEREWVPHVAVVGQRETDTGELDVLDRATGTRTRLPVTALAARIGSATASYPRRDVVERSVADRPHYG